MIDLPAVGTLIYVTSVRGIKSADVPAWAVVEMLEQTYTPGQLRARWLFDSRQLWWLDPEEYRVVDESTTLSDHILTALVKYKLLA